MKFYPDRCVTWSLLTAAEGSWGAAGVSVRNVGVVAAIAAFVVDDEQDDAQEEADGAHGDVGDAQERVFASHPGDGAQDHPLPALKAADGIIWVRLVKEANSERVCLQINSIFSHNFGFIPKPFQIKHSFL